MSRVTRKCAIRSLPLIAVYWRAGPRLSFGYDTTVKLYSAAITDYILQSLSYQKKGWWGPARQPFFWYDNDKGTFSRDTAWRQETAYYQALCTIDEACATNMCLLKSLLLSYHWPHQSFFHCEIDYRFVICTLVVHWLGQIHIRTVKWECLH